MRRSTAAALLLAVAVVRAQDDTPPEPPPDARVIRCVLDGHCRALVVPLGDELWAAWDTSRGSLLRVWQGDVAWDGPVYTTVHGPQPTSRGVDLNDPLAGAAWMATAHGQPQDVTVGFEGYDSPADGPVTLHWRLSLSNGERVHVSEVPEGLAPDAEGHPRVRRTFTPSTTGAYTVLQLVALDRPLAAQPWEVTGDSPCTITSMEVSPGLQPPPFEPHVEARLQLRRDLPTHLTLSYAPAPAETLEPLAVAEAAPPSEAASPADRRAALLAPPRDLADPAPYEPGVAFRIYELDAWPLRIACLEAGQTPNVDVVLRTLDLDGERGDFVALGAPEDMFLVQATTRLSFDEAGRHGFRLTSDDGSRLELDGHLLIDNDGHHPPEGKDADVELTAGVHELEVWMFEAGGGEVLRLEWLPPGAADFAPLPPERLSTPAGVVRVTSPGAKHTKKPLPKTRPGDGAWLAGVHPSFELHAARPPGLQPKVAGLALRPDGTLLVSTWDRDGAVYALDGAGGDDPAAIRVTRMASGLAEPLGLWSDGDRTFVLQKQELTELVDHDGDGITDEYRCACNGWPVTPNFHEFSFGLAEPDGWLYAGLAVAIDPGGRSSQTQADGRGSVIRIRPDDGRWELVAQGLRTPNGIGDGADLGWATGDDPAARPLYIADNQGDWLPSSKVVLVQPGAFYGNRSVLRERADGRPDTPPVAWLPQNEIGNSPSQPVPLPIGPWRGQMLVGDVTYGGLQRIAVERVGDALNGCVFAFSQGFEAGVNRLCWADGGTDLFVGGIGSTGNWGQEGKQRFGLQRLHYTGRPCFEMLDIRARADGLLVSFTEPLDGRAGRDPDAWLVESWRYEPKDEYGGPKIDLRELRATEAVGGGDGRWLFLRVPGLQAGRVHHVRALDDLRSDAGRELWAKEAWLTLNRLPDERGPAAPAGEPETTVAADQRAAGWRSLFDGTTVQGWHIHGLMPADGSWPPVEGWSVVDGALVRTGPGGDLVSDEDFGDFELQLDWRVAPGGNSGIFFLVDETPRADGSVPAVRETGVEMQILDNERHADGQDPLTSAGACYALHAPTHDDTRPPGHWNHVRLMKTGTHVEQWLNGRLQCSYDIGSDDWTGRVAAGKFARMPAFGRAVRGRIALQDHGDEVAFRNVMLRELDRR